MADDRWKALFDTLHDDGGFLREVVLVEIVDLLRGAEINACRVGAKVDPETALVFAEEAGEWIVRLDALLDRVGGKKP